MSELIGSWLYICAFKLITSRMQVSKGSDKLKSNTPQAGHGYRWPLTAFGLLFFYKSWQEVEGRQMSIEYLCKAMEQS